MNAHVYYRERERERDREQWFLTDLSDFMLHGASRRAAPFSYSKADFD